MSRDIPFFEMFAELQASPELRLKLAGAAVLAAAIGQSDRSISLRLSVKSQLQPEDTEALQKALQEAYGFAAAKVETVFAEPSFSAAPPKPAGTAGKPKSGKVLMGSPIKTRPGPMRDLNLKMGNATVAGKVFAFECRETRRPGMWRMSFDMTDYTNSVTIQKNLTAKEAQGLETAIHPGMWLAVQGKMEPTWDGKDIQLHPYHICLWDHQERQRDTIERSMPAFRSLMESYR